MKSKIRLFLFAIAFGASFATSAETPMSSCFSVCDVKYADCMSRGWLSASYCYHRRQDCKMACAGETYN